MFRSKFGSMVGPRAEAILEAWTSLARMVGGSQLRSSPEAVMLIPVRVDKYLRDCTQAPLAVLRSACAEGRVVIHVREPSWSTRVEGVRVISPNELVFDGDTVELDGRTVQRRLTHHYVAFHKPVNVTSTVADPDGQEDLSAWLARMPVGVFPVGRLDRATSGLLVCTSDGDLSHAILHPHHHVKKHYRLWVDGRLEGADPRIAALLRGVTVPGHASPLRALEATIVCQTKELTELELTLGEGKHRQIRKMCRALGLGLTRLHREAIGPVRIGCLRSGEFRQLVSEEVEALWMSAGGHALVVQRQLEALRARARSCRADGVPHARLEAWLQCFLQ